MDPKESFTSEQREKLLARLKVPFATADVRWRIAATSRDGKKGRAVAYADRRAFSDRLNEVLGPHGWTDEYFRSTSPTQRLRYVSGGKTVIVNTSKIAVFCKVTINGLGFHTGDGEAWADDTNGETRASAQAFRRACSAFGLGRYFYDLGEVWVPINQYGEMMEIPSLPTWALPPAEKKPPAVAAAAAPSSTRVPPAAAATANTRTIGNATRPFVPAAQKRGPAPDAAKTPQQNTATTPMVVLPAEISNQKVRDQLMAYSRSLGATLYVQIVKGTIDAVARGQLPKGDLAAQLHRYLGFGKQLLDEARKLASEVFEADFYRLLERHGIATLTTVSTLNTLKAFVEELRELANSSKNTSRTPQAPAA